MSKYILITWNDENGLEKTSVRGVDSVQEAREKFAKKLCESHDYEGEEAALHDFQIVAAFKASYDTVVGELQNFCFY